FYEQRGVRGAVREMDMEMVNAFAAKQLREIARIAGPCGRLHRRAVFAFVRIDQFLRPSIFPSRILLPQPHDGRRWRVVNRCLELSRVGMPNTRQRRMNRPDNQLETASLELEHLHVAKRLREDWVT